MTETTTNRKSRRPMTDEQKQVMVKARTISKIIGLIGTLDKDGGEQVCAFLSKRLESQEPEA